MARRLQFTIDGIAYRAVLQENTLAERIAAMCPFTMEYTRSGEHEYYASLPEKAAAKGYQSTTKGHRNGLYFFEDWNALSLVFRDCDTAPWQIYHIGDFQEDMSSALEEARERVQILCEVE